MDLKDRLKFREFERNRKGIIYIWLMVMVSLFALIVVYIVFDNFVQVDLKEMATDMNASPAVSNVIFSSWNNFPFAYFVGLIIFALLWTFRYDPDSKAF